MSPVAAKAAVCTFTWETQCGSGDCWDNLSCGDTCVWPPPPTCCNAWECVANWDDGNRWDDGSYPEGPPPCAYSYPSQNDHDAIIERSTAECTGGDPERTEDWLRINLISDTIDQLTVKTGSGTNQELDLRFESKDTSNTLTVDNIFTVDGVNGAVSVTVGDDAFLKANNVKLQGGTSGTVVLTVRGGAKIETYDPS